MLSLAALAVAFVSTLSALTVPSASLPTVGSATIYRDDFGVAHVYADDEFTLWYANGYVQAQDRFFEMDVLRHVGRGNAAGILGPGLLASDVTARRELYTEAQRQDKFDAMTEHGKASFRAFADGANRALAEMAASGNLPAEFVALNHAPEPWTPIDTVAVADFLLDRFGTGGGAELSNAALLARLQGVLPASEAEKAFDDLVWGRNNRAYATIPDGTFHPRLVAAKPLDHLDPAQADLLEPAARARTFGEAEGTLPPPTQAGPGVPTVDLSRLKWGSNALLVAPALSATGQALVGGGPQTGYFNPEVLYEVGLHGAGIEVVGVGVAGAPGVVLGRTAHFAWTVTSGISDQTDLVALPAAGGRSYEWDGHVTDLACRTEVHTVVNPPALGPQPPQVLTQEVCESDQGPILAITEDANGNPEYFWTARKVHRFQEEAGAEQWLSIDGATNMEEFRTAFDGFPFTFNFNYAGPEGACFHHVGTQPLRNRHLDPRLPTPPGEAYEWRGALTGAQLPRACDPAQGYFANWNNLPQRGWPSGDSRELWGSVHRVERLDREVQALLAANADGKLTLDDVKEILKRAATEDSLAGQIAPIVVAATDQVAPGDVAVAQIKAAFVDWAASDYAWRDQDADGFYDDAGHVVYDALLPKLLDGLMRDELGAFTRPVNFDPSTDDDPHAGDHGEHNNPFAVLVDALNGDVSHDWCDDAATPVGETCDGTLRSIFEAVAHDLGFDTGTTAADLANTLAVHRSKFSPIGAGPAYTMPMTNRATYYHFHVGVDTSTSGSALPPGQSGHLTVPDLADIVLNDGLGPLHMRDQLSLYNEFRLKVVPFSETQADAVSTAPAATLIVPRV